MQRSPRWWRGSTASYSTHGNPAAFERDRRKDQRLVIAGWHVVRFTDRELLTEPERVIATVTALLDG